MAGQAQVSFPHEPRSNAEALKRDSSPVSAGMTERDWPAVHSALNETGFAVLVGLLTKQQCKETQTLYPQPELFRSRVIMARHNFGRGEYQYFGYPLPPLVAALRE